MPHFFMKLIPPRPTFAQDMTDEERNLMRQHASYVKDFYDKGMVIAYGPVLDAEGSFGIALLQAADLEEVEQFAEGDPTFQAGLNRYTVAPMMIAEAQALPSSRERNV